MKKKVFLYAAALCLVLAGAALLWVGLQRPVTIYDDYGSTTIQTRSWTVERILSEAAIALGQFDSVYPALDSRLGWQGSIHIDRAHEYHIVDLARNLDFSIPSRETIPANLLAETGVLLFPGDLLLWNGIEIDPSEPLPPQPAYLLQIIPAYTFEVLQDGYLDTYSSAQPTLGQSLWEAGYQLKSSDHISEPLFAPVRFMNTVEYRTAVPVQIRIGERVTQALTAAQTTGEALAQAGISLQGMDYSIPAENQAIPPDGNIEVVSVYEEISLQQTVLSYSTETIFDSSIALDTREVIEPGQYGLQISRERVRYENGVETLRTTEAEWTAVEPKNEIVGRGTQVTISTVETPQGTMEYWRKITAYATSYSPCRTSGADGCSYGTASGMEVKKGVVAVMCSLFSSMRGQQVYVPGYGIGTIGDCGGGVSWAFWIDLAYSDDDYESWHQYVDVYFLTPVPAYIPYELQ